MTKKTRKEFRKKQEENSKKTIRIKKLKRRQEKES